MLQRLPQNDFQGLPVHMTPHAESVMCRQEALTVTWAHFLQYHDYESLSMEEEYSHMHTFPIMHYSCAVAMAAHSQGRQACAECRPTPGRRTRGRMPLRRSLRPSTPISTQRKSRHVPGGAETVLSPESTRSFHFTATIDRPAAFSHCMCRRQDCRAHAWCSWSGHFFLLIFFWGG